MRTVWPGSSRVVTLHGRLGGRVPATQGDALRMLEVCALIALDHGLVSRRDIVAPWLAELLADQERYDLLAQLLEGSPAAAVHLLTLELAPERAKFFAYVALAKQEAGQA